MAEIKLENIKTGMLYLVATPIGNLEDMTYRAVRILQEVDLVAAEDTRHTRKLFAHYDIHTSLTSYHEHNKLLKGMELIGYMMGGHDIACVSDAGMPGISDPGSQLARLAIEAGLRVSPLPGANAALPALVCSGLDTRQFSFVGFLPRIKKKRWETLADVCMREETLIFYEAPHHLFATLDEMIQILGGERKAVAARELTKKFEEFHRGSLQELADYFHEHVPRGEFVLLCAGSCGEYKVSESEPACSPREMVAALLEQGLTKKDAMRQTAQKLGCSRRKVYQALLQSETDS